MLHNSINLVYSCDSPTEARWFSLIALRLSFNGLPRVVVLHINISNLIHSSFGASFGQTKNADDPDKLFSALIAAAALSADANAQAQTTAPPIGSKPPNILVIWGDDIGTSNISHNSRGMMGYTTPNIDRIAREGVSFTDYYGQQSCTAGRAAFIAGMVPVRTGMTKVGLPGAKEGWQASDPTIAALLKDKGYATGQFGKNHFVDRADRSI